MKRFWRSCWFCSERGKGRGRMGNFRRRWEEGVDVMLDRIEGGRDL